MVKKGLTVLLVVLFTVAVIGCTGVPKETVELSYIMGENLSSIKLSYIALINTHFDLLKRQRMEYLENEWVPQYIARWIEDGRLIDTANGKTVWSTDANTFVAPERGLERQGMLNTVNMWSNTAIQEIEKKRMDLIAPIEEQKKELLTVVEDAFDRLYRGNAAITAYLNSIRKIKEMQGEIVKALDLSSLQEEFAKRLQDVSKLADEGLEAVKKADKIVGEVGSKL
jgi:hypothetical protein